MLFAIALLFLTATALANANVLEAEPNDTIPQSITSGKSVTGSISSGQDIDWYATLVASAGKLRVDFSSEKNSLYGWKFGIFDADNNVLAQMECHQSACQDSGESLETGLAKAGTYRVRVLSRSSLSPPQGSYTLTATFDEDSDVDRDGVGDTVDAFPFDSKETKDSDGDGLGNNADAFPFDSKETKDSDGDGLGNNADAFPFDSKETKDSDGDGIGDNADAYPNDSKETKDSDGDGVGNNADALPFDSRETKDSDDDGVGDNADAFPNDSNEAKDSDGDGVGDNADAFPTDSAKALYDCSDTSFIPKLASDSALSFEKRLVVANPASNNNQQSFLRFVNPWAEAVQVQLYAIDDGGGAGGPPISITLSANESKQMTAQDLEKGNSSKGIKTSMCDGAGKWRITVRSSKTIQIMGLIRTPDGFLTGLTDVVPVESGSNIVYFANPASNSQQQTFLRIVNNSNSQGTVTISAIDDLGINAAEKVSFELGPNESKQMTAQDLENGNAAKGLTGKLGDGTGKWRLTIASSLDLATQSLIRTPDGFLTNLSALVTPNNSGTSTLNFFNPANNKAQQSFMRLINTGVETSSVTISAIDDSGQIAPNGDVSLKLGARQSLEFSATDLEQGDADMRLMGYLGNGSGRWRLDVSSDPQISVMSYVLTSTGFLTNMSEVVGAASYRNTVWIFNPGSNSNQASRLRVINNGQDDAAVTITGIDDAGTAGPGSDLTFNLPYNSVKEITAAELENGSSEKGLAGGIGDGNGKWRLTVSSDEPVTVQSLLETPAGFITNLSTSAQ